MPKELSALDRMLMKLKLVKRAPTAEDVPDPDVYADLASASIDKAADALSKSIASIIADEKITDKNAEIAKQIATMRGHVGDEVSTHIEKAMRDVAQVANLDKSGDKDMPTTDELAAQIAALTKRADGAEFELAKSKLSPEARTYITDSEMSDKDQATFVKASAADQAKTMKDNPPKKKKTPATPLDPDDEMTKRDATIADLKKSIAKMEAERELGEMRKRAAAAGLPEAQADIVLKASKGDADAFGKLLDMMKASTAQAKTASLFSEFGSTRVAKEGSAAAEVEGKAAEIIKGDASLSPAAARAKVLKANPELYRRQREEERAGT